MHWDGLYGPKQAVDLSLMDCFLSTLAAAAPGTLPAACVPSLLGCAVILLEPGASAVNSLQEWRELVCWEVSSQFCI